MKREWTFVQGKRNKLVTSAMPLSYHLNREGNAIRSIFFSFTAVVRTK